MRGWLIFGAIVLTIAGCIHETNATNNGLPLVHASVICGFEKHICARTNCMRVA